MTTISSNKNISSNKTTISCNKKKLLLLALVFFFSSLSVFARNPSSISLGFLARYSSSVGLKDNDGRANFGINADFKINRFALDIDLLLEQKLERILVGLYVGFLPYYNNDIGEDYHSLTTEVLFGTGFEFNYKVFKNYYALTPSVRLAVGWTFPFALEVRAIADIGARIPLSSSSSSSFYYSVGATVTYSFDIGKAPYRYHPYKYYSYDE